jgi:hypothetical protein
MENKVHLFFQSYVAVNRAVKVIGFINPNPGPLEAGINDVLQDNLQRLSMLLVHGEQENGSIRMIIRKEARVVPIAPLVRKNTGRPQTAPMPKQMT